MADFRPLTGPMDEDLDRRTREEWMADQGLDVIIKSPKIIRPTWVNKSARKRLLIKCDASITRTNISFSLGAYSRIGPYVLIGTGEMDGAGVVLIRPSKSSDKRAFKPTPNRTKTRYRISSKRIMEAVKPIAPLGKYRLVAIKGGFYLALEEGRTCGST